MTTERHTIPMTVDQADAARASLAQQLSAAKLETGERMLRWFEFAHLPMPLQQVSAQFTASAVWLVRNIRSGPERTVALRKLLEAKDAGVRALLEEG